MKRAATEWAERALTFEENVRHALLERAGVLDVTLRLPVPAEGRGLMRRVLDMLGSPEKLEPVDQDVAAACVADAVERAVEGYEEALRQRHQDRLDRAGEKLPKEIALPGLSSFERSALKSFLLWAFKQDLSDRAKGQRGADLDLAAEAFGE